MSGALINTLINKQTFYELCDQYGIDHPGTFIYRREMGHDFTLDFQPPYICKPANGVAYWGAPFPGNEKVFTCPTGRAWRRCWTRSMPLVIQTP